MPVRLHSGSVYIVYMNKKAQAVEDALSPLVDAALIDSILELTGSGDPGELSVALESILKQRMQLDSIMVYVVEYQDNSQEQISDPHVRAELLPLNQSLPPVSLAQYPIIEQVIRFQLPVLKQPQKLPHQYAYPLVGRAGVSHVLHIIAEQLSETDIRLIEVLWKIWQHMYRLIEQNELDRLTGLLNRVAFDNRLADIFSSNRSRRRDSDNEEKVLALVDIDHFKEVNDKYGHLYGDEVLVQLARLMSGSFRGRDMVFRYGGEEFLVVLRRCSLEQGLKIMERFRQKAQEYIYPQIGHKTVSIGITEITRGKLPTTILDRADKALYYSKQHGRNQCSVYEELVQTGKLPAASTDADDVELF